jgi:hypothetical protein
MSGERPSSGARFVLVRVEESSERVTYRGFVHLPGIDVPAEALVELPGGAVRATLGEGGSPALVRSATKAAVAGGGALPRKIARWRG